MFADLFQFSLHKIIQVLLPTAMFYSGYYGPYDESLKRCAALAEKKTTRSRSRGLSRSPSNWSASMQASSYLPKPLSRGGNSSSLTSTASLIERSKPRAADMGQSFNHYDDDDDDDDLSDVIHETRLPKYNIVIKTLTYGANISHVILVIKYFILCLLDVDAFEDYRVLDCILMGRFTFNARVTQACKFISVFANVMFLVFRSAMAISKQTLSFDHLEFMLHEYDEVLKNEIIFGEKSRERKRKLSMAGELTPSPLTPKSPRELAKFNFEVLKSSSTNTAIANAELLSKSYIYSPILHMKRRFNESEFFVLRDNRTTSNWLRLHKICCLYGITMISALLGCILIAWTYSASILTTRRGFELNYINCALWISKQNNASQYEFIYKVRPNKPINGHQVDAWLPFEDYVTFNWYHLVRVFADFGESVFIWTDIIGGAVALIGLSVAASADIVDYIARVRANLIKLIEMLKHTNVPIIRRQQMINHFADYADKKREDVVSIQASVVDLLNLIRRYNVMAEQICMFFITVWVSYTLIAGTWLYLPNKHNTDIKFEWYIVQGGITMYVLMVLGSFSVVKMYSDKVYVLISSTMALDRDLNETKHRWSVILRLYFPNPLSCISLMGSSPVSWLLCLKLIAWIASFILVVGSLYSVHQREI